MSVERDVLYLAIPVQDVLHGGVTGVMFIVIGNGYGSPISNLRQG